MLNQIVLVGRLVETPHVDINPVNNKKQTTITLAVQRPYKNDIGMYDTDFIECTLHDSIATNTAEYCTAGDIIGVKGRLTVDDKQLQIVAEKVTFLSSRRDTEIHQANNEGEI